MENSDMKVTYLSVEKVQTDDTIDTTLLSGDLSVEYTNIENYSDNDMSSKMDHLMNSDTMILVAGMVLMILVGLAFRSICLRLSSKNTRKELVRGGLKEMARHMDHVTRAMSNDLDSPNSTRSVIRTYSNHAGKGPPAENKSNQIVYMSNDIRVQAFTNSLRHDMETMENNITNHVSIVMEKH
jgi:hypothetical protein